MDINHEHTKGSILTSFDKKAELKCFKNSLHPLRLPKLLTSLSIFVSGRPLIIFLSSKKSQNVLDLNIKEHPVHFRNKK